MDGILGLRSLSAFVAYFVLMVLPHEAIATPIYQFSGSTLIGVQGVDVNGTLYNVSFDDGTCASVFGSCDVGHFSFTTFTLASDAAAALKSALEGPTDFDSTNISGCGNSYYCELLVPYSIIAFGGTTVEYSSFRDYTPTYDSSDTLSSYFIGGGVNLANIDYEVWARFTPAPSPAPEPPTLALLGVGVLLLVLIRRRKPRSEVS